MKFFIHILLLIALTGSLDVYAMNQAISDGSSDSDSSASDSDKQIGISTSTQLRGRARSAGATDLQRPPLVKKLSFTRLSGSGSVHSAPASHKHSPHSPLARVGSKDSCASLPINLIAHIVGEPHSPTSSRSSSHRTPRGADEAEIYFAPDHDPKTIFLSLLASIRGRDTEAILATHEFSDPEIIDAFSTLPNKRLLCVSTIDATTKDRLLKAGVTLYLFNQKLRYTLGVFGNSGVKGSYIPTKEYIAPDALTDSTAICIDDLEIYHTTYSVGKIFDHVRFLINESQEIKQPSTTLAALAANPQSD